MIRQFSLQNEQGVIYSLMDVKRGFLYEPEGLGVEYDYSYSRIGSAWINNEKEVSQEAIEGTLVFADKPYLGAAEFISFAIPAQKLTLIYQTDAGTYYRDVDLVSMEKTEIGEGGVLQCPVVLMPTSLWYLPRNLFVQMGFSSARGLRYTYKLPNRFVNFGVGEVTIINDGQVDAPFRIEVQGPLTNPAFTLSVNGVDMFTVAITDDIESTETLVYSSRDGALTCHKTDANGNIINLTGALDIANANFFKIPVGTSKIKLATETQINNPVSITVYKQYKIV